MSIRIATDIGGTFTDIVSYDYDSKTGKLNSISSVKADTTPPNFEEGVINGLGKTKIDLKAVAFLAHGTTVVINALTERKGAVTGLVTTKGFRDVLEIARSNRPDLFNFNFIKQAPFVPRYLRMEVDERANYKGEIEKGFNKKDIEKAIKVFKKEGVKSIAICCLHAYKNPTHEVAIAQYIKDKLPNVPVICSHEVSREWREYERTSSTVLSAYVTPITRSYLDKLRAKLESKGLSRPPYIMQSNGGITTIDDVKRNPISIVESGPASGMLGAAILGKQIKKDNLIVLDIGGTTAKCSLIEKGELKVISSYKIDHSRTQAGYPIQTPVVDIVEIGNGGGSIAWFDKGGKLHVGPQSAGASPGPAAYGRGGSDVTTTDANILCGRIHADYFLGGEMKPNKENIDGAFAKLSKKVKLKPIELAKGILRVANANMVNALKLISVNKGYDPRDFSLMVIGGGGPMHAAHLAEALQVKEIIVPQYAGVFSALGMLMSDLRRDFIRTDVTTVVAENFKKLSSTLKSMEDDAVSSYKTDGVKKKDISFQYFADLRYAGQEHYVKVPLKSRLSSKTELSSIIENFHADHKKKYTFQLEVPVEWVNFHLVATVEVDKPKFPKLKASKSDSIKDAIYDTINVDFGELGKKQKAIVYNREKLKPRMSFDGPAIVAEKSTSTLVPPDHNLIVDQWGNMIIKRNK